LTARKHLSSVPPSSSSDEPYRVSARAYFRAGWSPLPLPPREKTYPPTGYTGAKGRHAEPEKVEYWMRTKPDGNVALRMHPNMIGIDVDDYGDKAGAATIAAAEEAWGPLPANWVSTSRTDGGVSGIRLFRVPEGLAWPGGLQRFGGGVELCRWDHRYVVVAPSVHPDTGQPYQWYAPDGTCVTADMAEGGEWEFPAPEELPELPLAWVTGLTEGKKWEEHPEEDLDPEEVQQWILDRPDGKMCLKMERTLDSWMAKISAAGEDGGAHDTARDAAWAVLRDSAQGHAGLQAALKKIMLAHREALRTRRPEKSAGEWASIKARGVRKVAAEGPTDDDDPCVMGETSRAPARRHRGSEGMDFARDDIGNGQRFALQWRDDVRWVPAYQTWYIWRDRIWEPDTTGEITRMATRTVRDMMSEAEYIEEEKERAAFRKFVRASSNVGKIDAMLRMARDNKGITLPAEDFDTDPHQLVCSNGTVVLPGEFSGDAVKRIPSIQEHRNTIETGTPYEEGAESPEWNKFLSKFQPDASIRDWLQKLAGYSLLGRNPRRMMVMCVGDTSTGKSTFALAVSAALGAYAGSANMTIFRDNQDEKPRPDLIRVLPKRFVYAEEASKSWHLHPDQIKRLTGGTPVTARTLQAKVFVDMVPHFTPWLLTNAAPTIEGADAALWRRVVVVPFDVQIPAAEEDARVEAELVSAGGRAAVLKWLVDGYRAYLADPDSIQEIPAAAVAANRKFRAEISDLSTCLEEICEFGEPDAYSVTPADLYSAYQMWCGVNGITGRDVMSATKMGKELNGMNYAKKQLKREGKVFWVRTGLRLQEGWSRVLSGV
jgi:putative DNA primase/helicase